MGIVVNSSFKDKLYIVNGLIYSIVLYFYFSIRDFTPFNKFIFHFFNQIILDLSQFYFRSIKYEDSKSNFPGLYSNFIIVCYLLLE